MKMCCRQRFVLLLMLASASGCTDLVLRPYRDDALVDHHQYVLGEQYVTVDGLCLCYQEFGEGEPLLILPGLATSIDFWQLNIPELAKTHHVIALDPPGCGKSDKPDVPYDLLWIRDRIIAFMDAKKLEHASFMGGSLGGHFALLVALQCPERADKLVLMGSCGTWPQPGFLLAGALAAFWNDAIVIDHLRRNWPDIFEAMFIRQTPVTQRLFRYQMAVQANSDLCLPLGRATSRALKSIFFHSCLDRLPQVRQPTLLIWGEQDRIHLRSEALAFRQGLPDSRLVIVPDAAHEVMIDQPEEFNRLVAAFLAHGTQAVEDRFSDARGQP